MLRLKRGLTATAGGSDSLLVDRVLNIAAGKDALNVGSCIFSIDIAGFIQIDLAFENRCVGHMADRDKDTVALDIIGFVCFGVAQAQARDHPRIAGENFFGHGVPDEFDLLVLEGTILHDLAAAKFVATMHDANTLAESSQVDSFLKR